jgi:hypothetical protein
VVGAADANAVRTATSTAPNNRISEQPRRSRREVAAKEEKKISRKKAQKSQKKTKTEKRVRSQKPSLLSLTFFVTFVLFCG